MVGGKVWQTMMSSSRGSTMGQLHFPAPREGFLIFGLSSMLFRVGLGGRGGTLHTSTDFLSRVSNTHHFMGALNSCRGSFRMTPWMSPCMTPRPHDRGPGKNMNSSCNLRVRRIDYFLTELLNSSYSVWSWLGRYRAGIQNSYFIWIVSPYQNWSPVQR